MRITILGLALGATLTTQALILSAQAPASRVRYHGSPAVVTLLLANRAGLKLTDLQSAQLAVLDPARRSVVRYEVVGLDRVPGKSVPRLRAVAQPPTPAVTDVKTERVIVGLDRVPGKVTVPVYREQVVVVQPDERAPTTRVAAITGFDRVPGKSVPRIERTTVPVGCPLTMLNAEQMAQAHVLLAEADLL